MEEERRGKNAPLPRGGHRDQTDDHGEEGSFPLLSMGEGEGGGVDIIQAFP